MIVPIYNHWLMIDEPKIKIKVNGNINSRSIVDFHAHLSLSLELSIDENPWKIEEIPNDRYSPSIARVETRDKLNSIDLFSINNLKYTFFLLITFPCWLFYLNFFALSTKFICCFDNIKTFQVLFNLFFLNIISASFFSCLSIGNGCQGYFSIREILDTPLFALRWRQLLLLLLLLLN